MYDNYERTLDWNIYMFLTYMQNFNTIELFYLLIDGHEIY